MPDSSEELNQDYRVFTARLQDGSEVTFKAEWRGYVDTSWHESGKPSTWDHPIDDRRCHWSAAGRIVRAVAVVVAGQDYWRDDLMVAFSQGHQGIGNEFVVTQLQSENCGMAAGRRDSDFQNMRNTVNGALASVVESDLPRVLEQLRGLPEVVEINV